VTELGQLGVDGSVAPAGVLGGDADDQFCDGRDYRGTPGSASDGVAQRRETSFRCQFRIVAGVTKKISLLASDPQAGLTLNPGPALDQPALWIKDRIRGDSVICASAAGHAGRSQQTCTPCQRGG
jgi:hypothetical protein